MSAPGSGSNFPAGLAAPARRALASAGYTRFEQLAGASSSDLLALHGMGPKALQQIRQALAERGLSLADDA